MSDSYQATYDAVRSKIQGCDSERAIKDAISDMNLSHYALLVAEEAKIFIYELSKPHVRMRPKLFIDGNQWCALYGDNLQDGVCGFGDSPCLAMENFDRAWVAKLEGL